MKILQFLITLSINYSDGERQFTARSANHTRMITRVRNSVERSYANLKRYQILNNVIPNKYIPIIYKLVRIIGALVNHNNKPLFIDSIQNDLDAQMLIRRIDIENGIRKKIQTSGWRRCQLKDFQQIIPDYDLVNLRDWCGGPYAIQLAKPYIYNSFNLKFLRNNHPEMNNVIKVSELVSRFSIKVNLNPKI